MTIQHLQGLIAAPFTPMDENGQLNVALIPSYYQFLKANKVTGAFICGSTGEGVSLTNTEKRKSQRHGQIAHAAIRILR